MLMKAICINGDWVKHNIESLYIYLKKTRRKTGLTIKSKFIDSSHEIICNILIEQTVL